MATIQLTACGGSSETSSTAAPSTVKSPGTGINPKQPVSKQLASVFPVPKPPPGAPSTYAAAIEAGRHACRGKKPLQVREEFLDEAAGLDPGQEKMINELPKYEAQAGGSPNFAAGQLAAGVYEATLPEKEKLAGYQGCVYELALQLRRELTKKQG
jgi:hypothetical protein